MIFSVGFLFLVAAGIAFWIACLNSDYRLSAIQDLETKHLLPKDWEKLKGEEKDDIEKMIEERMAYYKNVHTVAQTVCICLLIVAAITLPALSD